MWNRSCNSHLCVWEVKKQVLDLLLRNTHTNNSKSRENRSTEHAVLFAEDTCWPTEHITLKISQSSNTEMFILIKCDCLCLFVSGWQRRSRWIRCLCIIWPRCLVPPCWDPQSPRAIKLTSRSPPTSGAMMSWHRSEHTWIFVAILVSHLKTHTSHVLQV